jgi:hypothetical protein
MKCRFCGNEAEDQVIFGILERIGESTFNAKALVNTGYCTACIKNVHIRMSKKSLYYSLCCLAGMAVFITILALFGSKSTSTVDKFYVLGVFAFGFFFIRYLYLALKQRFSAGTNIEGDIIRLYFSNKSINGEDVVMPNKGESIALLTTGGAPTGYYSINANKLESVSDTNPASSYDSAFRVLKKWYDEYREIQYKSLLR